MVPSRGALHLEVSFFLDVILYSQQKLPFTKLNVQKGKKKKDLIKEVIFPFYP